MTARIPIPATFDAIGYDEVRGGLPLKVLPTAIPKPGPGELLVHVLWSSLNPLEHKLANLNFLGRVPPVVLGFDLAGTVAAIGDGVQGFANGDEVMAMADPTGDGAWAERGTGGYALARTFMTVAKPASVTFRDAAALPTCFLSAFVALHPNLRAGDTVYIPGGGGGVGHIAVQMARVLGAGLVISSGSSPDSIALARASGADHVFNYKSDDVGAEIAALTHGKGVDLVFDATYSDPGFVDTARMVRRGGIWSVLGVGPGKTTRTIETISPVSAILADRGVRYVNVNILRYFSDPGFLDPDGEALLQMGMRSSAQWAAEGRVVPHIARTVNGSAREISAALADMAAGRAGLGKIAVALQPDFEEPQSPNPGNEA